MALGPGKYDDLASLVRKEVGLAEGRCPGGVVLIVLGGDKGHGFSIQADPLTMLRLPEMLRVMADQIEGDVKQ